MSFPFPYFI